MSQGAEKSAGRDRVFAICFLLALVLALTVMAVTNRLIDPYGVFSNRTTEGFNSARIIDNVRLFKHHQIQQDAFDGVILGNSRAEGGIFVDRNLWTAKQVYNLAMPGQTLIEIYRNLQHAHAAAAIKEALIGFDFVMFSAFKEHAKTFNEDYLLVDEDGSPTETSAKLRTIAKSLLTADAFERSIKIFEESRAGSLPSYDKNGSFPEYHFEHAIDDYHKFRNNFRRFEKTYFKKDGKWLHGPGFQYKTIDARSGYSSSETYRKILMFCHRNGIALRQFISPIHVRSLYGRYLMGLQGEVNNWKTEIRQLNQRIAESFSTQPFPLWDFSISNDLTTEPLLPDDHPGARKMSWFHDGVHYTRKFGDVIQQIVLGDRSAPQLAIAMHLGKDPYEAVLQAQEDALEAWARAHPNEAIEIESRLVELKTLNWQRAQ